MFLYFLLALALTAADQAVKAWTVGHFAAPAAGFTATADAYAPCIPGILELTRVHNYGAAWSSFSGMRWLLSAVTAAILIAVLVLLLRGVVRHPAGRVAGALILGDRMSGKEYLGCVLMLAAVVLAQLPDFRKKQAVPAPEN